MIGKGGKPNQIKIRKNLSENQTKKEGKKKKGGYRGMVLPALDRRCDGLSTPKNHWGIWKGGTYPSKTPQKSPPQRPCKEKKRDLRKENRSIASALNAPGARSQRTHWERGESLRHQKERARKNYEGRESPRQIKSLTTREREERAEEELHFRG